MAILYEVGGQILAIFSMRGSKPKIKSWYGGSKNAIICMRGNQEKRYTLVWGYLENAIFWSKGL